MPVRSQFLLSYTIHRANKWQKAKLSPGPAPAHEKKLANLPFLWYYYYVCAEFYNDAGSQTRSEANNLPNTPRTP